MEWLGEPGLAWLIAGIALCIAELLLPGMFLLWLGLAALGDGIVCRIATPSLGAQVVIFAALAVGSVLIGIRKGRARPVVSVNRPDSGLVGRQATALGFVGAEGRVRLGDSDWPARLPSAAPVAQGAVLVVDGVDGLVLLVHPVDAGQMAEG
jgi:inner membrane protein